MAIDTLFCVGCDQCSLTCKVEHNLPDEVWWSRARTSTDAEGFGCGLPEGTYPNLSSSWYTLGCQHCDNPACLEACPTGATEKREDGLVTVDPEVCIGCKSCIAACPYEGVRTLLDEEPQWYLDFPVGDAAMPAHVGNTVGKCTFCVERIDRGERPACVDVCQAVARYFGDLDDPDSEISKVLAEREYDRLLEDQGTGPNVYFLK
ncbi:4Fe-4S dicluster domain-containing protein [Adlercreutzia sp. R7]|uniref:4Fe-4S dicluster domain-containing protein n=1 Tax=Adlercreutzia wanghongyangiae TaxID=3111451 RepID=A0ABU6IK66_9ACTN|nr:4Fe-4S dicluster domain-containing protein [Adlercreutzia sp. R7]